MKVLALTLTALFTAAAIFTYTVINTMTDDDYWPEWD